jgi:hypothetical protein
MQAPPREAVRAIFGPALPKPDMEAFRMTWRSV